MPELPEVETVRTGLTKLIVGKTIASISSDWPKSFPNAPNDVEAFVIGARITGVNRRAKVLLIQLSTEYTLLVHLKMTGQLVFVGKEQVATTKDQQSNKENNSDTPERFGGGHPNDSLIGVLPDRSTRVSCAFTDGSTLFFNDQRKFGWMRLFPTMEVPNIDFMKKLGPEPLNKQFTSKIFVDRIKRRSKTSIKAAILDQTVLAGVGNIYADESLFAAKIHPAQKVADVPDEKLKTLLKEIKKVLALSIEKGGSSDRNYVNAEGKKGSYISFAKVFRREGQLCMVCGSTIEKSKIAGRGTHTCPMCQTLTKI